MPPPPSLDELLHHYDEVWLSEGYQSSEEEAKYKDHGRQILTKFWRINSTDFKLPLAVEQMFNIDIEGIRLVGFIDRLDKLDSGGLSIVDYKTNQKLFTRDYLKNDLQLTLYQLAIGETWFLPVEKLTLYHLRSNTPCSCPPRGEAQLEAARHLVLKVAEDITQNRFPATENRYCPCDFAEHCPYYRHKYSEVAPELEEAEKMGGVAIDEAVERYVFLQDQIKELEFQLDEVRQEVIDFCQGEELKRVYGKKHAITYRMVEKTSFSEEAVRALLEPLGLWPQVLSLDPSRLKQLITDERLAQGVRAQLTALRQVIASYPQLRVKRLTHEE